MFKAFLALLLVGFAAGAPVSAEPVTTAQPAARFKDCRDCPEMIVVPAGMATLGSSAQERAAAGIAPIFGDREGPAYQVRFARPFAIGRTEINRRQYGAFVKATARPDPEGCGVYEPKGDSWGPQPGYNWHNPGFAQNDDDPAVCISFDDAVAYAAWLSAKTGKDYRLPSDAEWEYAARAGTQTAWYWGDDPEPGCAAANLLSAGTLAALGWPKSLADRMVCSNGRSFTVPVGSYAPNPFGLHDMLGNAFEWVADCNSKTNADGHTDGSARTAEDAGTSCDRHYLKGGAFHTPFWLTRAAVRGAPLPANLHMFAVGFRIARSLAP